MSAISARVDWPGTAETVPTDAAVAAGQTTDAGPNAEANPVEIAQPVSGLPLQEEDAAERHKALTVARIRLSKAPASVKERFVELAEAANNGATVEACLKAVEEALPDFLRENRAEAARGEHPAGEVFFRGNAEEITEQQAEEVARRQLERSGLLRGQRVRVAD